MPVVQDTGSAWNAYIPSGTITEVSSVDQSYITSGTVTEVSTSKGYGATGSPTLTWYGLRVGGAVTGDVSRNLLADAFIKSGTITTVSDVDSAYITSGTIDKVTGAYITSGTITTVTTVSDVDSAYITSGTITTVSDVNSAYITSGTITAVTSITNAVGTKPDVSTTTTVSHSTASGNAAIWTPTAGSKFVIGDVVISSQAANDVRLYESGVATNLVRGYFAANGGLTSNFRLAIKATTADRKLMVGQTAAGSLAITITGWSEG